MSFETPRSGASGRSPFRSNGAGAAGVRLFQSLERRLLMHDGPEPILMDNPADASAAIRIDAGGNGYVDGAGNVWEADAHFSGGKASQLPFKVGKTSDD